MRPRLECEFALVRYVPDVVKGEFTNIGVVLREAGREGTTRVEFTRDWARVRCMDPDADTEMLEALEAEVRQRLAGVEEGKPVLQVLEDTLSNSVQMTAMQGTLAESFVTEMEQLLRMYVEPLKTVKRRKTAMGRTAIVNVMRNEFERAGVWDLMRKRIAASEYTRAGDPLKIDCGYRNGRVRMFHAVSLESDVEGAKGLAFSAGELKDGVRRSTGVELELTAVIERISQVSDAEQYRFGVDVMEQAAVRVLTTADLGRVAETAKRELRVG